MTEEQLVEAERIHRERLEALNLPPSTERPTMPRYSGHYPGHMRDAFMEALEKYYEWEGGEPEPTVEMEVRWRRYLVTIRVVFGKFWNCSDILPGFDWERFLEETGLEPKSRTYGAIARAILTALKEKNGKNVLTLGSKNIHKLLH
jgi:hypothetical protein